MFLNPLESSEHGHAALSNSYFFFSIIFVLAIPFATASWIADVFRKKSIFIDGPLARSRAEADRITPVIFSA